MFDGKPYVVIDDWEGLETSDFKYVHDSLDNISYLLKNSAGETPESGKHYFNHLIQGRAEKTENIPVPNSLLYTPIVKTITRLMDSIGIEYMEVGRIAINTTIHYSAESYKERIACIPHVDHSYRTIQMIIYLNDVDGDTLIYDKVADFQSDQFETVCDDLSETDILHKISPKKNRIVLFDGAYYHTHYLPSSGYRSIIVASIII